MTIDSYDDIPYDSAPIYETHPSNLAVPGALFGLDPAPAEACRYLELGCASGGNLIPLAFYLPESEFLGIERSTEQVRTGRALIEALGLRNVRIEQADVSGVEPEAMGVFDYIVAHGFYSWVPGAVRRRMFEIMAAALTPQGIAYVSYNALPGWRRRSMLRDLLRYAVRGRERPRDRLDAAWVTLERYEAALAGQTDAVAAQLRDEAARLRTRHPSYLYHEYLVEENTPFLFSEFMTDAGSHGLQYLCEAELHTMFSDNLGAPATAWIDGLEDVIAQEQIMDFLRQRTFRQTLLCRHDLRVERELDLDRFARLAYHGSLAPVEPPDLKNAGAQAFCDQDGGTCVATSPLAKAALVELGERHPDAVAFPELAARARDRVRAAGGADTDENALLLELVRLYLRQYIGAALTAERFPRAAGSRPRATRLARAQALAGLGHVATRRHKPMGVDAFVTALLGHLDGCHDRNALVSLLHRDIAAGRLRLDTPRPGRPVEQSVIAANVEHALGMLAHHGILEPEAEPHA